MQGSQVIAGIAVPQVRFLQEGISLHFSQNVSACLGL